MLTLDSDEWAKLSHAYGIAIDIPPLLAELGDFPPKNSSETQPYLALWSSLCHQNDVYEASYAAVPHIVAILESAPKRANEDFFHLPVRIEICRCNGGPAIPGLLRRPYFDALSKLPKLVHEVQTETLREEYVRVLSASTAVSGGQIALAGAILELEPRVLKRFMEWVVTW